MPLPTNVLALDIGEKRIGVARVNMYVKLPESLPAIAADGFQSKLRQLVQDYDIDHLVVGLPRNMSGEETAQTAVVRQFCDEHIAPLGLSWSFVDETLTSVEAQARLGTVSRDGQIDSEAARILLESYIAEQHI